MKKYVNCDYQYTKIHLGINFFPEIITNSLRVAIGIMYIHFRQKKDMQKTIPQ